MTFYQFFRLKDNKRKLTKEEQNTYAQINYFTVQSYKGLESSVVFYIDLDGFISTANRKMNYVAMSRARALLYMYVDDNLDDEYLDMMDEGLEIFEYSGPRVHAVRA